MFELIMLNAPKYIVLYLGVLFILAVVDEKIFNCELSYRLDTLVGVLLGIAVVAPIMYTVVYFILKLVADFSYSSGTLTIQF